MPDCVYEDDNIEVHYHNALDSNVVLIVFNPMDWHKRNEDIWGFSVLSRSGYSILGVTSKAKNWFPEQSIYRCLEFVLPILRNYPIRLLYGYSMGGYGALRYSKVFGASHVLALSPQSTINPQDLGEIDKRYLKFFNHDLHRNMRITAADVCGKIYIVYDREFLLDSNQVNLIGLCNVTKVHIPRVRHGSITVIAKSKNILEIIDEVLKCSNANTIRKYVNKYRRLVPEYYESMLNLAAKRQNWILIDVLYEKASETGLTTVAVKRKYAELLARQKRYDEAVLVLTDKSNKDVCNQKANYLIAAKRFKEAVEVLSGVVKNSDNLHFSRTLARAYELSGDPKSAVEVLEPFEFSNSKNPDYLCHLGRLLSLSGQESRGKKLCKLASDLRPSEPYFMNIYKNLG